MRLGWPLALVALALIPAAIAGYALVEKRRARFALRFTNLEVLASIAPAAASWRRFVPPALLLLALTVTLFSLARPQVARSVNREQATIVLVVDTSGSMVANDVRPNRLAAAQEAVRRFVGKLPGRFRVAIVAFSSEPRVTLPVTDDHELATQGLSHMIAFGGTALGDALGRAVDVLRTAPNPAGDGAQSPAVPGQPLPPSAIVLLSDGAQNRGRLQPLQGARRAKQLAIPVFTVALGTESGTIRVADGNFAQTLSVPPDPETLKRIALETGGQFYSAASGNRLNSVYEGLASRLSTRREYQEATFALLAVSALLLVGAGVASVFWLPRLP